MIKANHLKTLPNLKTYNFYKYPRCSICLPKRHGEDSKKLKSNIPHKPDKDPQFLDKRTPGVLIYQLAMLLAKHFEKFGRY